MELQDQMINALSTDKHILENYVKMGSVTARRILLQTGQ